MRTRLRAFTLVELLIGITISVLIIGAAATTYFAAVQSWDRSRSRTGTYQYARAALDIMERHVRAALPPDANSNIAFEGESAVIEGTELSADSLRLSSTGGIYDPARFGSSDLNEVTFYLDISEETGEPSLMMRQRRFAIAEPDDYPIEPEELAPRVVSFDVKYYDGIEFVDEWFEETLPDAVRVSLLLYDFGSDENPVVFQKLITPNFQ